MASKTKKVETQNTLTPVIAIGASAGALDTLERFFSSVPGYTSCAFVLVQHLSPDHKSMMDELLSRKTKLPISVIDEGMDLKPGNIYLTPPRKMVGLKNGAFIVKSDNGRVSFPITHFFESLANHHQENCVAIIISGTGSDGSEGLTAIKAEGGLTIVQDIEEAAFDGMPASALRTGMVDIVCNTANMYRAASQFFDFQKNKSVVEINQLHVNRIVSSIKNQTGLDFSGYKDSTLSRRITRRMGILGINNLHEFSDYLKRNPETLSLLADDLMIGVTSLFRDPAAFSALTEKALPVVFKKAEKSGEIRVWVSACSTGEEAYSMAITILEELRKNQLPYGLTVFATDINASAVRKAGNKIFSANALKNLSPELVQTYFVKEGNGFKPAKKLRDIIVFSTHDLFSDAPFSKIDLISCRNLLIYLRQEKQENLIQLFRFSLKEDGILFLGSSESLGALGSKFNEVDKKWQIYQSKSHLPALDIPFKFGRTLKGKEVSISENTSKTFDTGRQPIKRPELNAEVQEALIQQFAPSSVVYTDNYSLLHVIGKAGAYLENKPGSFSNNLLNLLPGKWATALDLATTSARKKNKSVQVQGLIHPTLDEDEKISVRIDLIKKSTTEEESNLFAASFEVEDSKRTIKNKEGFLHLDINEEAEQKIKSLEYEIRSVKESLQSTIEELESSNEELQTSNEELQSSNEELESVNEELYTVNAEYLKKVEELNTSNNDLNNLLQSTNVAILFLDDQLRIRKFTNQVKRILNLDDDAIGKTLDKSSLTLPLNQHMENIEGVMDSLIPNETTISSDDGMTYILMATPFRTSANEIKGIVVSLVDISKLSETQIELANTELKLEKTKQRFDKQQEIHDLIEEHLSDMICIHNREGIYDYVSPSAKELVGYSPDELQGKNPYEYFHSDDEERIRAESHEKVLNREKNIIEYRFRKANGEYTWLETKSQFITDRKGRVQKILTTSRDVTHRKELEDRLKLSFEIIEKAHTAVCTMNEIGDITYTNKAYTDLTGYSSKELEGRNFLSLISKEDQFAKERDTLTLCFNEAETCSIDISNHTKNHEQYWVNMIVQPIQNSKGELSGFFSVQQDITDLKKQEQGLLNLNMSLENHNKQLTQANTELQDFAYIISHDLKEPVRGVEGLLGLMESDKATTISNKSKKYMTLALDSTKRMGGMIESLLDYSRSGSKIEQFEKVNLEGVLNRVLKDLYNLTQETKAHISANIKDVHLFAHRASLVRLFQNLLSNSLKYRSEKAPRIEIKAHTVQNNWLISIKDNGMGIKEKDQKKIFQLFNKVSPRTRESGSHGVGLAICKRIANSHGGDILVESKYGRGSTFTIVLPVIKDQNSEDEDIND